MPKKTTKKKEKETRESFEGFKGALLLPLKKKMKSGKTLKEELQQDIGELLDIEYKNHEKYLVKLSEWQDQYHGVRKEKNWPWPRCSNIVTPLTRSDADALLVRLVEALRHKRKIAICRTNKKELMEFTKQLEKALDHYLRRTARFLRSILPALMQSIITGTGIVKIIQKDDVKPVCRYATKEEQNNKNIKKYPSGGGTPLVKTAESIFKGPKVCSIDRADYIQSSDAAEIDDAYLAGFRFPLRKPQLKSKVRQGGWDADVVKKIVNPDEWPEHRKKKAEGEHKELKKPEKQEPYYFWELWFDYDVDEDGEEDGCVIIMHRETQEIVKAFYNPLFKGFKPFEALRFYRKPFSFDGEGASQILESTQIALDTSINQLIDYMTLRNAPMILTRAGTRLAEKLTKWEPAKIVACDDTLDSILRVVELPDVHQSPFQLQQLLLGLGDRAIGITPSVLGMSAAERPVFRESAQNLGEANKKFVYGIDNEREDLANIIYKILEFFVQYNPSYTYPEKNEKGEIEERTVDFPVEGLRENLEIEVVISSDTINQEMRLQRSMTVYQLLKDYNSGLVTMAQVIAQPNIPPMLQQTLLKMSESSANVFQRILDDFDQLDAEDLVVKLTEQGAQQEQETGQEPFTVPNFAEMGFPPNEESLT